MIGVVNRDLCSYTNASEFQGPANYLPSQEPVKPKNPRAVFGRDGRFASLTRQYISKEHNQANLCTASRGPKYTPKTSNMDLQKNSAPKYSFRSKGDKVADRGSFLNAKIQEGYIYQAKPATGDKTDVSAATYTPNMGTTKTLYPRAYVGRAQRFGSATQYISRKHTKTNQGINSPGPAKYNHTHSDLATQKKPTRTPKLGTWTP
jgi:hypothetical protein